MEDAPQLTDIPDTNFSLGDTLELHLDQYATDCDHLFYALHWEASGHRNLTVWVGADRISRIFSPHGWTGSETVMYHVSDPDGNVLSDESLITVYPGTSTSDNQSDEEIPEYLVLYQNYPNPFNAATAISYALPGENGKSKVEGEGTLNVEHSTFNVSLKIYNILGREVRTLIDETQEPGFHSVQWDGRDAGGVCMPSGMYFCSLTAGEYSQTKRMVLTK